MKWVSHVQTLDGKLHHDYGIAKRYAEARYGEALTKLAHQLAVIDKYGATCEFIDANLNQFIALKALHTDITLEPEED